MKKALNLLLTLLLSIQLMGNDGSYLVSGNTLIPINNKNISIEKEILTIKKIENNLHITVDYTFYNHGEEDNVLVGFEANVPFGDVDYSISEKGNPYMKNFTVLMNGKPLKHGIKLVENNQYLQNNAIKNIDFKTLNFESAYENYPDHLYVYYFNAPFKKGENKIIHTYTFEQSGYIMHQYNFDYILTAANRWKGGNIKDFTLILDLGEYQDFFVEKSFFSYADDWEINGDGASEDSNNSFYKPELKSAHFAMKKGTVTFQKDNFTPRGELYIFSERFLVFEEFFKDKYCPIGIEMDDYYMYEDLPLADKKIMRNYPFARKGYVFKNKELMNYYSSMFWYKEDPTYTGEKNTLNAKEKEWVDFFDQFLNK